MKSVLTYNGDALTFGSKSIRLAETIGAYEGPFYLYDSQLVRERFTRLQEAFKKAKIFYAMKANSHPVLLKALASLGAGADVVSGGEVERALECGFTPRDIIFSGVGKTVAEIRRAIQLGLEQLNVESLPELERIEKIARELKTPVRVAFRVNPDVSVQTHPYIATGLAENKFGLEMGALARVHEIVARSEGWIQPVGLSLHLGSQLMEFSGLREALQRLRPVFLEMQSRYESFTKFDAGGGLGVDYEIEDPAVEERLLKEYAEVVLGETASLRADLQLEPGRWLVARAGVLVAQVQYVKQTSGRTFVILDTGMNHLIRPALYQAHHRILPLQRRGGGMRKYDVVGPICESADFMAKEREMPVVEQGDFVAISDAGAYGFSMANQYNLQRLPEERIL